MPATSSEALGAGALRGSRHRGRGSQRPNRTEKEYPGTAVERLPLKPPRAPPAQETRPRVSREREASQRAAGSGALAGRVRVNGAEVDLFGPQGERLQLLGLNWAVPRDGEGGCDLVVEQ